MGDGIPIEVLGESDEILAFYRDHPEKTLKTLVCRAYAPGRKEYVALVTRGDLQADFDKLARELGLSKIRLANPDEMARLGLEVGYVSPLDCGDLKIVVDLAVEVYDSYYDGANEPQRYRRNVNYPRDFQAWRVLDFAR
jgi:prolyl-tRNA editing enzyme YbaK/EbsC (Cys-tRNA(Pro) deacylase)